MWIIRLLDQVNFSQGLAREPTLPRVFPTDSSKRTGLLACLRSLTPPSVCVATLFEPLISQRPLHVVWIRKTPFGSYMFFLFSHFVRFTCSLVSSVPHFFKKTFRPSLIFCSNPDWSDVHVGEATGGLQARGALRGLCWSPGWGFVYRPASWRWLQGREWRWNCSNGLLLLRPFQLVSCRFSNLIQCCFNSYCC